MAAEEGKISIGLVEDVILLPWKIKIPARIDTGAALSSLDARDIKIENNMVSFKLPPRYKGLQITLPSWSIKASVPQKLRSSARSWKWISASGRSIFVPWSPSTIVPRSGTPS